MALFGKKTKDAPAPAGSGATSKTKGKAAPARGGDSGGKKKGISLGRKKGGADAAPAAPAAGAAPEDEFFDFSEEALAGGGPNAVAADSGKGKKKPAKAKGLKSGTVVGLNIGTDSIKVIELRAKGNEIVVTGMGMLPTPEDSIANGVVMSVASLSHAIRDVMQQAGIKSKRVITSVAGTGALVVRVIEVPKMSDNELEDNMKVDADRYIPFPPSEVIMDFKALRDLPSDPDAPNMEVLLAAAQREIIDLHVQVMEGAKLDPRSIDVEPLSAVRALNTREIRPDYSGPSSADFDDVDYNDVSAVVNIGAASTEISIVRGDILVFTRNVPTGGQTMTQAIVDYFGLHWPDAENAKRTWGDALPRTVATPAAADYSSDDADFFGGAAGGADDWSEFGLDDITETAPSAPPAPSGAPAAPVVSQTPVTSSAPPKAATQAIDPFATPISGAGPATAAVDPFDLDFDAGNSAGPGSPAAADPFDLDFFNQGPQGDTNKEPGEQHGQKEGEPKAGKDAPVFDFSTFNIDDDESGSEAGGDEGKLPTYGSLNADLDLLDDDDTLLPSTSPAPQAAPPAPAPVASAFDFPTSGSALPFSGTDVDDDDSTLPTVATPGGTASSIAGINSDIDDDTHLPTATSASSAAAAAAASVAAAAAAVSSSSGAAAPAVAAPAVAAPTVAAPTVAPPVVPTPVVTAIPDTPAIPDATPAPGAFSFGDSTPADTTPAASPLAAELEGDLGKIAEEEDNDEEIFDFDTMPTAPTVASAAPAPVPGVGGAPATTDDDDFDLDSLFDDTPATAGAPAAPGIEAPALGAAASVGAAGAAVGGAAPAAPASAFAADVDDFGGFDNTLDSFGAGLTDTGLSSIDEQELYGVLSPILESLAGEVRRSLEYHATRYPDAAVQRITLVGGGAKLKNIDAFFAQSMGVPTTIGNPLAGMTVSAAKLPPNYANDLGPVFTVALGLALRDLVR